MQYTRLGKIFGLCAEDDIAMTPYSALAIGRLSRKEGHTRRATEDDYARGKYDSTAEQDPARRKSGFWKKLTSRTF